MDEIQFPESFDGVSTDDLTALRESAHTALLALVTADAPSDEDVAEATRVGAGLDQIDAELSAREAAATERAAALSALRERFARSEEDEAEEDGEEDDEAEGEGETDTNAGDDAEPGLAVEEEAAVAPRARATLARRTVRPKAPANTPKPVTITAAADVPDFSNGQQIDMAEVATAMVNRMRGFGTPTGDGTTENLQHYGVAKFTMDFPEDLTILPTSDDTAVLTHAADESRLRGKSLVAAGGWCAPSETLYDLCVLESTDGLVSLPEVNVSRGGIKYTKGPDWATLYAGIGFSQTEAQAISGTAKSCYSVACPTFTEVRLDAVGVCIKAPILTNAAYPELIQRVLSGSMVVHAHRVNAAILTKMAAASGAAYVAVDYGATTESTNAALTWISDLQRQKWKMALNQSMEVVIPFWVKGVIREDLAQRGGRPIDAITDAYINAEFAARNMSVQWVYDWQEMTTDAGWPATVQVMMYPSGTFVKGTTNVISLNAVYDAASLATNDYTALFFEQGVLVANLCNESRLVTVPICASGKTGAQSSTACGIDATP